MRRWPRFGGAVARKKRKAVEQQRNLAGLRAGVREKLDAVLDPNYIDERNYYLLLSGPERDLIAREMPGEIYRIFGFSGVGPFVRPDFLEWIKGHKVRAPFVPPDLSREESPYQAATAARAAWWAENGLPVGKWERDYLEKNEEKHGTGNPERSN